MKGKGKKDLTSKGQSTTNYTTFNQCCFLHLPKRPNQVNGYIRMSFYCSGQSRERILDGLPETPVRRLIPSPGSAKITNRRKSQSRSLGLSSPCFSRGFPICKMVRVNEMFFCSNFLGSHRYRLNNTGVPFIQWRKWKWPQNTNTFQW